MSRSPQVRGWACRGVPILALTALLVVPAAGNASTTGCPENIESVLQSMRQLRTSAAKKRVLNPLWDCLSVTRIVRELSTFQPSPALAQAFRELSRMELTRQEAAAVLVGSRRLSSLRTRQEVVLELIGRADLEDLLQAARLLPPPLLEEVLVQLVPPTADCPSLVMEEDDPPIRIKLTATDPTRDPLDYRVVSQPRHGRLEGEGRRRTYRPFRDYFGTDSFEFQASDGRLLSNVGTVSITVTPVNDPPVGIGQSVTTREGSPVTIVIAATDVDNDAAELGFQRVDGPGKGTLHGDLPTVEYRPPDDDFHGRDQFTFKALDGSSESAPAKVVITVTPVNDPPIAHDQSVTAEPGQPISIKLTASDVDNRATDLTYQFQQASNGRVAGVPGTRDTVTYTSNPQAAGSDRFEFWALDGTSKSTRAATVTITIRPKAAGEPGG